MADILYVKIITIKKSSFNIQNTCSSTIGLLCTESPRCLDPFHIVTYNIKGVKTIKVLILHGISEIGAHVKSNICYLICSRHLIRMRSIRNRIFFV